MCNGISDTSISQISAECQLSIGAIYANFENKADLARYIVTRLFDWRIGELEAAADTESLLTPPAMSTTTCARYWPSRLVDYAPASSVRCDRGPTLRPTEPARIWPVVPGRR
jgi:AcrR family transcriptional regulator